MLVPASLSGIPAKSDRRFAASNQCLTCFQIECEVCHTPAKIVCCATVLRAEIPCFQFGPSQALHRCSARNGIVAYQKIMHLLKDWIARLGSFSNLSFRTFFDMLDS